MKIEMKGNQQILWAEPVLKDAGFVLDDGEVHALMEKTAQASPR